MEYHYEDIVETLAYYLNFHLNSANDGHISRPALWLSFTSYYPNLKVMLEPKYPQILAFTDMFEKFSDRSVDVRDLKVFFDELNFAQETVDCLLPKGFCYENKEEKSRPINFSAEEINLFQDALRFRKKQPLSTQRDKFISEVENISIILSETEKNAGDRLIEFTHAIGVCKEFLSKLSEWKNNIPSVSHADIEQLIKFTRIVNLLKQYSAAEKTTQTSPSIDEVKKHFICPLSKRIMHDPVILIKSGITYNRASIVNYLEKNNVCPVTGTKIYHKSKDDVTLIVSNEVMRKIVNDLFPISPAEIISELRELAPPEAHKPGISPAKLGM